MTISKLNPVQEAVKFLGGPSAVLRLTEKHDSVIALKNPWAVTKWGEFGLPDKWIIWLESRVAEKAKEEGVDMTHLTRRSFRPELYPPEDPAESAA